MTADSEHSNRVRRLSATAWAIIAATVALLGSAVTLIFTLVPSLAPDPREQVGAALTVVAVDPGVTLGDWAHRAFPDSWRDEFKRIFGTASPGADQLEVLGDVIYVRTQVDGYKHRSVVMHTSVYDREHDSPDAGRIDLEKIAKAPRIPALKIDAPDRSSVQLLFIPAVGQVADVPCTFVRIELDDPHGALAISDTANLLHGALAPGSGRCGTPRPSASALIPPAA